MTIRGSCACYGHADECVADRPEDENVEGIYLFLACCWLARQAKLKFPIPHEIFFLEE